MGSIKLFLNETHLPERENHHSRLFVDVSENVHIHHREFRTVFSVDEFLEYADIIKKSADDVRNFLAQNLDYKEQTYPTGIMIAGGKERQLHFLQNSPRPNKSEYFPHDLAIELQDEFVTDEVHIHYRDFRLALNREHFKILAQAFEQARKNLEEFELSNEYVRQTHSDRLIRDFNTDSSKPADTPLMGVTKMPLEQIKSSWHADINKDWRPDKQAIKSLKAEYKTEGRLFPVLVSTETDGSHLILDGHHRVYAANELGLSEIDVIVSELSHTGSEKIRAADVLLKEFDKETNYKYGWSHFMKAYVAFTLNRHYTNSYSGLMRRQRLYYRIARKVKRLLFGKRHIFRTFYEASNNG